jgi:methionyl-tRNA formyltransferase
MKKMEKSKTKVVFMGTPDFSVPSLNSLYNAGYSIEAVITQKDKKRGRGKKLQYTPVKQRAVELEIEVFQPENINDDKSKKILESINPDFIVVVAYGQILRKDILSIPRYGCYNVHASLLPKYRGAAPINWVIIEGENETGVTIMEMEEGLDTGDMILSSVIKIDKEDTTEDIHDKLANLGSELIVEALEKIFEGNAEKTPQDHLKSSYASMLTKEMGKIDWNDTGSNIVNLIRGLKPWPSAYTIYNEDMVKIHKVSLTDKEYNGINGEIVKVTQDEIYVKIEDGSIKIGELQFPGKRKMTTSEYLKGNSIEVGTVLK